MVLRLFPLVVVDADIQLSVRGSFNTMEKDSASGAAYLFVIKSSHLTSSFLTRPH